MNSFGRHLQGVGLNVLRRVRRALRGASFRERKYDAEALIRFENPLDAEEDGRPIALCWRMNDWKAEHLYKYLPEYRVGVLDFRLKPKALERLYPEILASKNVIFVVWGATRQKSVLRLARRHQIPIWRAEDGFLRSFGPGELHTRPHSLVFDKTGVYFDGRAPSDLENFLKQIDLEKDPVLKAQAEAGLDVFRAGRLSKYFAFMFDKEELETPRHAPDAPKTLLIGQMEQDASVRYGRPSKYSGIFSRKFKNSGLAHKIMERFPEDRLLYKPHPDSLRGRRRRTPSVFRGEAFEKIGASAALSPVLRQVDRVVTQTSLSGMEALIHGKEVVTYGYPFYAGWGLTQDAMWSFRRNRKLTLEELFAGVYLLYPRYLHPGSSRTCSFLEVACYFIVENVKYKDLADLDPYYLDMDLLEKHAAYLSAPANLLIYLSKAPVALADAAEVKRIYETNGKIEDFPQISFLLVQSSNYDILKQYADRSIAFVNANFDALAGDVVLLQNLFAGLAAAQKGSNGRVFLDLGNFSQKLMDRFELDPRYGGVLVEYLRVSSNNLLYEAIAQLLTRLELLPEPPPHGLLQKMCATLSQAPSRSERHHERRRALLVRAVQMYRASLDADFSSTYDLLLNAALGAYAENDADGVERALDRLRDAFPQDDFHLSHEKRDAWGKLAKRDSHFRVLYEYLLKARRFTYAQHMLKNMFHHGSLTLAQKGEIRELSLDYQSAAGDHRRALSIYNRAPDLPTRNKIRSDNQYARALRGVGEMQQARSVLVQQRQRLRTPGQRLGVDEEIEKLSFAIETSAFLSSYPQPHFPKGVVFLASQTCYNTLAMMAPALYALKKRGYAFVNLMEGMTAHEPTGLEFIDQFANVIPMRFHDGVLKNEWRIDWPNRVVEAEDVNFYQGFYERLSTQSRSYWVDLNQDAVLRSFMLQLRRTDFCLDVGKRIFKEVVGRGLNVSFVSGNSHVTPFSAFRDFARAKDHPKLNFINCNVAYESYFSNLGGKFASTMAVTDMTLHKDRRAPFLALPENFERWYAANKNDASYREQANRLIHTNRTHSTAPEAPLELLEFLVRTRAEGRKVLCAFGKVPVDLNVPYDGGPGHLDMADWLNHTVQIARECPDILLLIKPHPHELKPEIALDLIESFSDLISGPLPENVRILGHREINTHAIAEHLDLALLWNGSSSLELAALGRPVLMASHFGKHDYPVKLIYPESREQYAAYLKGLVYEAPSEETRDKAAFLITYMGTDEISIRNEYSFRAITNDKIGVPRWNRPKLDEFLMKGDPGVELIASRIIEKFS